MLRKILKDSLPTIVSLLLSGMYSVIDGLFIGMAVGNIGLAAINIAWPVTAVITAVGIGIGTGGSVLLSHARGEGKDRESRQIGNHTVTLLVLAGFLITALLLTCYPDILKILGAKNAVYIEAEKYSRIIVVGGMLQILGTGMLPILRNMNMSVVAMVSMVSGLFLNIGINYMLMFHYGLGIQGAAYGTVAAQGVVAVVSLWLMAGKQKVRPCLQKNIVLQTLKSGITAFGMSLAPSVTLIFANWQCLSYGGEEVVACYAVISYITFPVQYMLSGIGDGTQPLLSFYHGAGKKEEVQKIQRIAYRLAGIIGVTAMVLTFQLTPYFGGWFGLSGDALACLEPGMKISAIAFWLLGYAKFNIAYLNATMQTKKAIILTYAESFLVAPVLLYLLPLIVGIYGIWLALAATSASMLLIYKMMLMREKQRKD